jgi:hypothetical protein
MRGNTMKIDYELLREQKEWLMAISAPSAFRRFNSVSVLQARDREMAEGLLHLLDAIQETAICEGRSEEEVYGSLVEPSQNWPRES